MSHRFNGCGVPGNSDVEMVSLLLARRCKIPTSMQSEQDVQVLEMFSRAVVAEFNDEDYLFVFIHEEESSVFDTIRKFIDNLLPCNREFLSARFKKMFFDTGCRKRTRQ